MNLDGKNHCCIFCLGKPLVCSSGAAKVQYGPGKGGRRVYFLYIFVWQNFCYCAFYCLWFCWQKRRSRKAKEWPAETFRKGRENPYLTSPVGDRERHPQQFFIFAVRGMCVCIVNYPWQLTLGGGSFLGEFRDLDQGVSASITVLHFRLIPSDYQIKPVWTWFLDCSISATLGVFCFVFPTFPSRARFAEGSVRKPEGIWIMWMIGLLLWPLWQIHLVYKSAPFTVLLCFYIFLIQLILIFLKSYLHKGIRSIKLRPRKITL